MTSWWQKNLQTRMTDFSSWIGDFNKNDKIYCRKYVATQGYKSLIDCGCGLATEFFGYKNDNYDINYTGLDSCQFLIERNKEQNITMIEAELESPLSILDSSYECVYCREVLEHLSYYENAIKEFIRIGQKEIIISWFIKPDSKEDEINYWDIEDLFHNKYNIEKLEKFILDNPKVDSLFWKQVSEKENILHIKLKV